MACVIGPSICQQCYEVSEDVVSALSCVYAEDQMRQIAEPGREPGKYQLDLWAACYETLKEAGVPPKSIQVPECAPAVIKICYFHTVQLPANVAI